MPYPLLHPADPRPAPLSISHDAFRREYREGVHVELKTGIGKGQLESSAAAFMNADGGLVFVGVADDGKLRGRRLDAGTEDDVHQRLRTIVGAAPYEIVALDVDGTEVTVIRIWPLEEGFAQLSDGRVLMRNGTRDDALMGSALARFVGERAGMLSRAERRATSWTKDDAEPDLGERLAQARGWQAWRARRLAESHGLARTARSRSPGLCFSAVIITWRSDARRSGSELRPSTLTVRSPGGLPPGVSVEGLREAQVSRNPAIAELLRYYRLAEQRGQGIDLIQDEMRDAMLQPPRFTDLGDRFDVELPLAGTVSIDERAWVRVLTSDGRLHSGDQVVLVHATRGERLTNGRVQQLLGVSERGARESLQRLVAAGLLLREGQRGGTSYILAPDERRRVTAGLSETDVRTIILDLLREQETITNSDVRRAANLDRPAALRQLELLLEEGVIVREGERRGTRYRRA